MAPFQSGQTGSPRTFVGRASARYVRPRSDLQKSKWLAEIPHLSVFDCPEAAVSKCMQIESNRMTISWIKVGILSLSFSAAMTSAADAQQWRPSLMGASSGTPGIHAQQIIRPGLSDPRFRPVPRGRFMPPPRPPVPAYPGRPFVSVQGQYAMRSPVPAFARQYAWRPAERPLVAHRSRPAEQRYSRPLDHYQRPPAYYPMPPAPPAYLAAQMPYGMPMGYPPAPTGFMPPPMPFPPVPGVMPGGFPPAPYTGYAGMGMPPSPQAYPTWGAPPYPGMAMAGYPPAGPQFPAWPGMMPPPWPSMGYARPALAGSGRNALGTGVPLAGLY